MKMLCRVDATRIFKANLLPEVKVEFFDFWIGVEKYLGWKFVLNSF